MSARDEAIAAMTAWLDLNPDDLVEVDAATAAIDAIPPNVLARLAIQRGGLERTLFEPRLYRVVEP